MSLGDIIGIVQGGGPDAIFLLLVFIGMSMAGRIYFKREIDMRDELIERLTVNNEKQAATAERTQALFDQALQMLKEGLAGATKAPGFQ